MTFSDRSDTYSVSAAYYDEAYSVKSDLVDLPFYLEEIARAGGATLELGCGTGRVLLPAARAGATITGIEPSQHMRSLLEKALAAENADVRKRVTLVDADMRTLNLGKTYPLIICPFRPLQHLYTVGDQLAAFAAIRRHLAPGGRFVFDVFSPRYDILLGGVGDEKLELEWAPGQHPERIVRRFFKKLGVSKVQQVFQGEFIYRTYEQDKLLNEDREQFQMSYYTYPQLQLLAHATGWRIASAYGGFDRSALTDASGNFVMTLAANNA